MGWLGGVFSVVSAFVSGFVGHIVAHDVCEAVPTFSARLVRAAARSLPSSVRDRYTDEWLADLYEQKGVFAKLKWALGCFKCARRMSREALNAFHAKSSYVAVFDPDHRIELDAATFNQVAVVLKGLYLTKWLPKPIRLVVVASMSIASLYAWRSLGRSDHKKVGRVLTLFTLEGASYRGFEWYVDGKRREYQIDGNPH